MRRFSKNGHYSVSDYKSALERKKKVVSGAEYVDSFLAFINESNINKPTSAQMGLVKSVLSECITLETFVDQDGNEKLRVANIVVPEDLKDFFVADEKGNAADKQSNQPGE